MRYPEWQLYIYSSCYMYMYVVACVGMIVVPTGIAVDQRDHVTV